MNEHDATEIAFKNGYKQGKIDTVRKMQERLKERIVRYGNITFKVVPIDDIDETAKEMLEDTE
jgi:hypothetical protein